MEKWKQVESIPRLEVSDKGNVRCYKTKRKWYTKKDKIGYIAGQYKIDGKRYAFKVHRLVALAFLENPENKREVNHIDGDKSNNDMTNLEWVTRQENIRHAFDTGLNPNPKGSLNGRSVLTEELVHEICKFFQDDPKNTPKKATEVFGISQQQATKIRAKLAWKHVSEDYVFVPLKNSSKSND